MKGKTNMKRLSVESGHQERPEQLQCSMPSLWDSAGGMNTIPPQDIPSFINTTFIFATETWVQQVEEKQSQTQQKDIQHRRQSQTSLNGFEDKSLYHLVLWWWRTLSSTGVKLGWDLVTVKATAFYWCHFHTHQTVSEPWCQVFPLIVPRLYFIMKQSVRQADRPTRHSLCSHWCTWAKFVHVIDY